MHIKYKILGVSELRDLARTKSQHDFRSGAKAIKGLDRIWDDMLRIPYEISKIFGFVVVFNELYLEAQKELDKVLGH